MRAVQMLDFLADEHEVTLLAPAPGKVQPAPPAEALYRVELYQAGRFAFLSGLARALLERLPLQNGLFHQPHLKRRLRELAPRHDLGVLQLVRLAGHSDEFGDTPIVVDLIDSLSLSFSKRAEVDRWWLAPFLRIEARLLANAERRLAERSERLLVVCERDRQALIDRLPPALGAKVAVVPLSVAEREIDPPPDKEGAVQPVLVITGNLGYFVNADAVTWWLREVWPDVRRVRPDVHLVIAGDRPSSKLRRAIAKAGARLVESPRDLRGIIAQATLSLAPMRCGAGVPIKVLEAWAVGVPVLASSWAAAGTSGRPGEDFIIVEQQPAEWVAAITDLLENPSARHWLIENGHRRLTADYSRETVRRQVLDVVRSVEPTRTAATALVADETIQRV